MLIHRKCGQKIVLDLSDSIVFVSGFGYKGTGLNVTLVNMQKISDRGRSKFLCPSCQKPVPISELEVFCSHCGRKHPATEAVIPNEAGGIFCKACADAFFPGEYVPLELSRYTIDKNALKG
jgi:ribosomal protein L37AE/L43A